MSEETLRRFLEKLNGDASFKESVQQDPKAIFGEFELSPSEQVAIASQDEDALRRLTGADVSAFLAPGAGGGGIGFQEPATAGDICNAFTIGCTVFLCTVAGMGRHCGTGGNCGNREAQ